MLYNTRMGISRSVVAKRKLATASKGMVVIFWKNDVRRVSKKKVSSLPSVSCSVV